MSDTLRERCEKLVAKWGSESNCDDEACGYDHGAMDTSQRLADELRAALATPEPAASAICPVCFSSAPCQHSSVTNATVRNGATMACPTYNGATYAIEQPASTSQTDLERVKSLLNGCDTGWAYHAEKVIKIDYVAAAVTHLLGTVRAEKDREADALIELALRMMDAYHMSGEIGIADIPTVASVRAAAKRGKP